MKGRYQTPLTATWFLRRPGFRLFMIRELTSVFVAAYLVYLLIWIHRIGQGPRAYDAMIELTRHKVSVFLHSLAFGAALHHSTTWFNLTPKIMPMYIGEDRVPDAWAAFLMGYGPWAAITALLVWGVLR